MLRRAMFTLAPTLWPGIGHANDLLGSGWRHGEYPGLRPARFTAIGEQGLRIEGHGTGSFVWRRVSGVAQCLSWRWRVDEGPPPTDLTRRFGDDRAISVAVGFAGFPSRAGPWQRAQHAIAQGAAGNHTLPRSVLIYSWGGTGREPVRFYSPWLGQLGKVHPLRHARSETGRWFEERVDLDADWRAAFGGEPPHLQEIAIGTDVDDTSSRVDAQIDRIRVTAC
jgi:hypothetical protein